MDVEEKARAKDIHGKKTVEGGSSAYVVQILNTSTRRNSSKNSNKRTLHLLRRTTTRKRGIVSENTTPGHYAKDCPDGKWKPKKKSANMIEADGETSGYDNLLYIVLLVFHSPDWWVDIGANIHVCADISLFSSYQVGRTSSLLMGNGACAAVVVLVWSI